MKGFTNMFTWSRYVNNNKIPDPSFIFPLMTNTLWLTNSEFFIGPGSATVGGRVFTAPSFVPTSMDPSNYLDSGAGTGPLPQLGLILTNHVQAYIEDVSQGVNNPIILDYVQLGTMGGNMNINQAIADPDSSGNAGGLWSTNFYNGGGNTPFGVDEQYIVSSIGGSVPTEDNDGNASGQGWTTQYPGTWGNNDPPAQAFFSAFFSPNNAAMDSSSGTLVSNIDLSIQAPYTPMRRVVQKYVYEANDPLVHYLTSDLNDYADSTNGQRHLDNPTLNVLIGAANNRYMPWGSTKTLAGQTYNNISPDVNSYNLAYKDPLVNQSDNWDFPTNKYPAVGWLGRVHRGTPWQSVYLKSSNILARATSGMATWALWTGDNNGYDATNSAPLQDRLLFDLFTATPNSYGTPGQLNVNVGANDYFNPMAGLASWSALLGSALVFSNSANDTTLQFFTRYQSPLAGQTGPGYIVWTNQPGGINLSNSPIGQVVRSINSARTNYVAVDGLPAVFEHAGDILSASRLSDSSPFLDTADATQVKANISDEMYEWLPQQIMSLVTVSGTPQSPPRYVVYCYGQTLKPAPDGIVTSGTFFGLCTNYQVIAESASRAIIRVDNTPTPGNPTAAPHIIVEQYNPLPPD
jgi:hypothetical protein